MIGHRQFQTGFELSAEDLQVRLSATIWEVNVSPSRKWGGRPGSTALISTDTSDHGLPLDLHP